jgi:hypothetical protein
MTLPWTGSLAAQFQQLEGGPPVPVVRTGQWSPARSAPIAIAVDVSTMPRLSRGNVPFCVSAASGSAVGPHWAASAA